MAISLIDNLDIKKKSPDVARQLFDTIADMVAYSENYLPSVYECNVADTGKRYRYMATNEVDSVLGKWREIGSEVATATLPLFLTKSAMKSYDTSSIDKMGLALCFEDGGLYLYNENNEVDEAVGRWRKVGSTQVAPDEPTDDNTITEEQLDAIVGTDTVMIDMNENVLVDKDGNVLLLSEASDNDISEEELNNIVGDSTVAITSNGEITTDKNDNILTTND